MKKTAAIIIALMIILTGCQSPKNDVNSNGAEATLPGSNAPSQAQSENTTQDKNKVSLHQNDFEKGYYDYQGTIGDDMSVQMSLYPLEKEMVGSYFYKTQGEEISLKGMAQGQDIILFEFNKKGERTATFMGTMTGVDKIEGTWVSNDNKKSYPFVLSLVSILPGAEYGKRYEVAVSGYSDQEVEDFATKIRTYIRNSDKEMLSELMSYPITVKLNDKPVEIQNKADFIARYDEIFHPEYKQAMSNASTKYMFANWKGIMFGEGLYNIWINQVSESKENGKLMITAINN